MLQPKIWWKIPRLDSGDAPNVKLAFKIRIRSGAFWSYYPENGVTELEAIDPYVTTVYADSTDFWKDIDELCSRTQQALRAKLMQDSNVPEDAAEHFFCTVSPQGFVSFYTNHDDYSIRLFWNHHLVDGQTVGAPMGFNTTQYSDWSLPSRPVQAENRHACGVYRSASGTNLGVSQDSGLQFTDALITSATSYSGAFTGRKFGHKQVRHLSFEFIGKQELEDLRSFWLYASTGEPFEYFEDANLSGAEPIWVLDEKSRRNFAPERMFDGLERWRWNFSMIRKEG